ncbi:AMP-binding protein [Natronomonas salsuginis]|uniref:Cyclohexanecarboxylate-CoA ligase n=1 Tax=Natronomonas salsuginis TaxID=2217661 RepID=A0A4U5JEA5_9EURY|nr:AMP-binding protein [Natronomonas salsuginis]TKR26198.1 cyclohexanecarboxylate-CoA ligase [Natronomonas salsuginis]
MRPDRWSEQLHEQFTEAGQWVDRTLLEYVETAVESTPDRTAIVDRRGTHTYVEMVEAADELAQGLATMGVGTDDVIASQIPNRAEGAILHLAALKLGAVYNPIVSIYRESEVGYMIEKLETTVYAAPSSFSGFEYVEMGLDLADEHDSLDHVISVGGEIDDGRVTSFESIQERGGDADSIAASDALGPNDLALIQFTSGTTGQPKAAMHTENTLLASQNGQIDRLGLESDDVVFTPSPIGHLTGIQHGYRLAFMLGTTCVFQEKWDAETGLEWIESEACTYMAGATPFVRDLSLHEEFDAYDTSSLRRIMTAGAPCPAEVVRQAHENFENVTVCRGWGQTENTLPTVNPPDAPAEKLETTDGKPYGGMEVRIRKPGELEDALPGEEGELQVRGPFLFLGYLEDPERTAASFTDDEWFKTGDKAIVDDDGYVMIKGRIKDIIIRGGENIPVREIEEYLHQHPKVADGAIVAMPDERLQERGCAYVLSTDPDDPLTFEEMVEYLKSQGIATQKLPERLEIVDELPMTASGKVQRYKLREDIADKLGVDPVVR